MAPIPAWPDEILRQLDAADARAQTLAEGLSPEDLNWAPAAGSWSVGQCLEHLSLANEVYVGPMVDALRGKPIHPVNQVIIPWFGRWFIRQYIDPATQKARAKAPRVATPVACSLNPSILDRFLASNVGIRAVVERAREYDVNRIRFRNPFVPVVRFTIGTGLWILARHNHRHLNQAERVRRAMEAHRSGGAARSVQGTR